MPVEGVDFGGRRSRRSNRSRNTFSDDVGVNGVLDFLGRRANDGDRCNALAGVLFVLLLDEMVVKFDGSTNACWAADGDFGQRRRPRGRHDGNGDLGGRFGGAHCLRRYYVKVDWDWFDVVV